MPFGRNLPVDTYVPGHGPVYIGRNIEDLREFRTYFLTMRGEVARLIPAGRTSEEVTKAFQTPVPFEYGQAPASCGSCHYITGISARSGSAPGNGGGPSLYGTLETIFPALLRGAAGLLTFRAT